VGIQAREDKVRERIAARVATERAHATKVEMDALANEAGVVVAPTTPAHH